MALTEGTERKGNPVRAAQLFRVMPYFACVTYSLTQKRPRT